MKKFVIAAFAVSTAVGSMAMTPALAGSKGNAYGQGSRVCLITYDQATSIGLPLANVVKAQYLPIGIALKLDTANSLLVTYGPDGATDDGITHKQINVDDAATNPGMSTEEACAAIQDYVDSNSED